MKSKRHEKILELIATLDIQTQEELLQHLQSAGMGCTQATISRDIKELRIVKEMTPYGTYRYAVSGKEVGGFSGRLHNIFKECVTGFDYAQNLVVIHTLPGLAGAAASAVDAMQMHFMVGTIAGDDTVLLILRDTNAAAAFCKELKELLP
jgi:transcriptional regulator of arginine metabolism